MKLSEIGELSLIETIRSRFSHKSKDIIIGIGDDAAVLRCKRNLLVTTDMMVEGIHFDLHFTTPYQLGFKIVSVNVSDIYAMGGKPRHLLLDIAMNKDTEKSFIKKFFDGIQRAIGFYGVSLIGGDVSSSEKDMVIAATLIGDAEKPIKRSGARPGDKIYVTGNLGDSACGLEVLKKAVSCQVPQVSKKLSHQITAKFKKMGLTLNTVAPLIKRHLMPEARNPEKFIRHATSMIDISDGLFIDLSRLCDESKVGAKIYKNQIPISNLMKKTSEILGLNSFTLATSGGEDYELLFTAPSDSELRTLNFKLKLTCIGEITEKHRFIVDEKGKELQLKARGYQHFEIQR